MATLRMCLPYGAASEAFLGRISRNEKLLFHNLCSRCELDLKEIFGNLSKAN